MPEIPNQTPVPKQYNPSMQTPNGAAGFSSRSVEQPVFSSATRAQLVREPERPGFGGFRGFYQANKLYIWAGLLGIIMILLLAYFAFHKTVAPVAQEAKVSITIDAPSSVASGGEEVYAINLLNQDSQKLTGIQLEIVYPSGVSFLDSQPVQPSNLSKTEFDLQDLPVGIKVPLFLKTKVIGNVGDSKNLIVRLHYHYSNFSSEFVKEQQQSVALVASDIAVTIDGPATANNGQLVIYSIKYQNNSDSDAQNVRIKLTYADGFQYASADPQPDLGTDTWNIGTLAKGGSGKISIQGIFNSNNPGESKPTKAELLILGGNGQYFTQSTSNFITAIANQPLLVQQSVEGKSQDSVVNPGDSLAYTIKYQNNASVAANAVNIAVTLDSKALDLSSIQAEGAQISNDTITWNASSASKLQVLAPNEGGTLRFTVRVKDPAVKDSSKNLTVVSHAKIKSNEYDTFFPGNDMSLKISSPATIASTVTFTAGQLPPRVGQDSSYRVTFTLKNSTNDFSNTTVTGFIPLGAGSFDRSSVTPSEQANVTFDPATGKFTWIAGALPAHTGQFSIPRTMSFAVRLNPSSSQVYQSPILVKTIVMDAMDIFTSQPVHYSGGDIRTSDLGGNDSGKGQVQP